LTGITGNTGQLRQQDEKQLLNMQRLFLIWCFAGHSGAAASTILASGNFCIFKYQSAVDGLAQIYNPSGTRHDDPTIRSQIFHLTSGKRPVNCRLLNKQKTNQVTALHMLDPEITPTVFSRREPA
jgi:hypothetical protein